MRLLEYQAKEILRRKGVPIPDGRLVCSPEALKGAGFPLMLKAQAPTGGRGKAGGVSRVEDEQSAAAEAARILELRIKDSPVPALLAEEPVEIERELYLAFLLDRKVGRPMIMACPSGGVEIEEIARTRPDLIWKKHVDPGRPLPGFTIYSLAKHLGLENRTELGRLVETLIGLFLELDATLVEINPLAVVKGSLLALDAKIELDDKAAHLHRDLYDSLRTEQRDLFRRFKTPVENLAAEKGLNYVRLDGDVGLIADGAGTGMLTLDLIHDHGGRPANFCEMGGLSNAEVMETAVEVLMADDRLKALLISLIGGMTRMDQMAEGLVAYLKKNRPEVPIVVRMCGTRAEVGTPMLQAQGLEVFEDLDLAAATAVRLAQGE